jgi:hypothetical protein
MEATFFGKTMQLSTEVKLPWTNFAQRTDTEAAIRKSKD